MSQTLVRLAQPFTAFFCSAKRNLLDLKVRAISTRSRLDLYYCAQVYISDFQVIQRPQYALTRPLTQTRRVETLLR